MVVLIPSEARNDLSSGEARVFHEIKEALGSRDWIVFHSLAISSAYSGRYGAHPPVKDRPGGRRGHDSDRRWLDSLPGESGAGAGRSP